MMKMALQLGRRAASVSRRNCSFSRSVCAAISANLESAKGAALLSVTVAQTRHGHH
jgi:hypothetical protein